MSDPAAWIEHKLAQVAKVVEDEQRKVEKHREYPITLADDPLFCIDDDYHHPLAADPLTLILLAEATRKLLTLHGYTNNSADGSKACVSCGTHDECSVEWPCDTIKALAEGWGWSDV